MALTNREETFQSSNPTVAAEHEEGVVLRRRRADWSGETRATDHDGAFAAQRAAVSVAAATLTAFDGLTGGHSDDVVTLSQAIADDLGLPEQPCSLLLAAAQLHDIGKVAVPSTILEKPGALDAGEWQEMRRHTVSGEQILLSVPELTEVGRIVRHSHERYDGSGYPDGLAGDEIPLESRIVFCADAYHAIRCDRPYRRGRSAASAMQEIRRNAGTQFDPLVADALERTASTLRRSAAERVAAMSDGVRSRRLVALLLTLVVGGSAMAAPGSPLHGLLFGDDDGQAEASICAYPCPPGQIGAIGPLMEASGRFGGDTARRLADPREARGGTGEQTGALRGGNSTGRGRGFPAGTDGGSQGKSDVRGVTGESEGTGGSGRRDGVGSTGPGAPPAAGAPPRFDLGGGGSSQTGGTPKPARPLAPGRSGEAPRRPASPGEPTGPGPGRSGEAPGKPNGPGKFGND